MIMYYCFNNGQGIEINCETIHNEDEARKMSYMHLSHTFNEKIDYKGIKSNKGEAIAYFVNKRRFEMIFPSN